MSQGELWASQVTITTDSLPPRSGAGSRLRVLKSTSHSLKLYHSLRAAEEESGGIRQVEAIAAPSIANDFFGWDT